MRRCERLLAAALAAATVASSGSGVAEIREFPGLTRHGPSGLVLVPTGHVIRPNWYAVGLHRGVLKANYGILGYAEVGVTLPDLFDKENFSLSLWDNKTVLFVKVGHKISPENWWVPSLAAGAENSLRRSAETLYFTGTWGRKVGAWPVEATVGAGTGLFSKRLFVGIGFIPQTLFGNSLKFIGEYAGQKADIGARFALSKNLRLDFVILVDAYDEDRQRWNLKLERGLLGASKVSHANWKNLWFKKPTKREKTRN